MNKLTFVLILALGVGLIGFLAALPDKPGAYDDLAQCITDSGAVFYGAFWCQTCTRQKSEFGKSASLLPYEECSTTDRKDQLQICKDKNIKSYPTWEFSNGERLTGSLSREDLTRLTGCDAGLSVATTTSD